MGLTDVGLELGKDLLGPVRELGDFIRAQRTQAQISLRALADKAGVSNPYLSQVERGLRRPSAVILTQIADGPRLAGVSLGSEVFSLALGRPPVPASLDLAAMQIG